MRLEEVARCLARPPVLSDPGTLTQRSLIVPRQAAIMLAQILGFLANGQGVTVTPSNAMLTTQQAADFLNVSRPYLIKLLEAGEIPFEKVGTHRRVAFGELMDYKRRDDHERRRAADELTELGQELGEL